MNLWEERNWHPMLLEEIDKPFDSKNYIYEIKFDGTRACIFVNDKEHTIINRHGKDITYLYPELINIRKLVKKDTIIDGEIICLEGNAPSFRKLQLRAHLKDKKKIKYQSNNNPVIFIAFDILYANENLTDLPLMERKKELEKIKDSEYLIKSKIFIKDGIKLFESVRQMDLEGIVAKEKNSIYEVNRRRDTWLKIKCWKEEDFFIGGYRIKKDSLSLILGEKINKELHYVGNVKLSTNNILYKKVMTRKKIKKSLFKNYKKDDVIYIKPTLKCTVKYMEKTASNHLRQPFIKKYQN